MKQFRVAVVGATGMVGQRFLTLLDGHPWFQTVAVAASPRSAGQTYGQAVAGRWVMDRLIPEDVLNMTVLDASDIKAVSKEVDFIFCAVDMPKAEVRKLEEAYASAETPVISNNSACRMLPDVPMLIPELNADHARVIDQQRRRLGSKRGFIAVKPNCSIQSYVPVLHPLRQFGLREVSVCTYQAVSGAGKTLQNWPEMLDNVIPFIGGEEEKSEQEPLKIWGTMTDDGIELASAPNISAQCLRVPVSDGHMAAVSVRFDEKPSSADILAAWRDWKTLPQELELPSAPKPFLRYFEESDRPQTRLDRDEGRGMAVSIGRLREDPIMDWRFVALSHNTLRGAAGGGVLSAELLCKEGWIEPK
ncbi:aspartate-semialdehyde dehydrogenase [Eubacteriales bacterium OttesenSCG-928-A19]|nr:aspartate-semialdehyde dehydrogenase [Eubacteriales bacterium OttesenSCG-928-A19]